jgi:hypothetical protein
MSAASIVRGVSGGAVGARGFGLLVLGATGVLALAGCGGSTHPALSSLGSTTTPAVVPTATGAAGGGGECSDPNPSNLELTFAAVVCVTRSTSVAQSDGSSELELMLTITDKDPNAFDVTTTDFRILDSAGHDLDADAGNPVGRTGAPHCILQQLSDDGYPVSPGQTFTMPGPICFNVAAGDAAKQLVWQGDVSVPLAS